ncbi:MAG TPA: PaaI family thioesterase [Burkholderiaceae bacterium]|nr:PaaI family thioesterase [Burkholderiaceae bacterium]
MQQNFNWPDFTPPGQGGGTQNPYLDWLGVRLAAWTDEYAEMHLRLVPQVTNRSARVHGGVLCTLLDSVAGYSGCFRPEGEPLLHSVTLSLTTQFLDSRDGTWLIARGKPERLGRTVFFARSEVWLDGEYLLASASGTFKYIRHKTSGIKPVETPIIE